MKLLLQIVLIFILVDILIVGYVVYKRSRRRLPEKVIQEIQDKWKAIIRQKDQRHAIMDADKLLDHALTKMGYKGSLGNKLKQAGARFKNVNNVWKAHKVRNNIAHQIDYKITDKIYKDSMLHFKQAFKDLKIF